MDRQMRPHAVPSGAGSLPSHTAQLPSLVPGQWFNCSLSPSQLVQQYMAGTCSEVCRTNIRACLVAWATPSTIRYVRDADRRAVLAERGLARVSMYHATVLRHSSPVHSATKSSVPPHQLRPPHGHWKSASSMSTSLRRRKGGTVGSLYLANK